MIVLSLALATPPQVRVLHHATTHQQVAALLGPNRIDVQYSGEDNSVRSINTTPWMFQRVLGCGGTISIVSPGESFNRLEITMQLNGRFDAWAFGLSVPEHVEDTVRYLAPVCQRQGTSMHLAWRLPESTDRAYLELPMGSAVTLDAITLAVDRRSSPWIAGLLAGAWLIPGILVVQHFVRSLHSRAFIAAIWAHTAVCMWLSTLGHNFDLQSYQLVSDLVLNHESVYANTSRYNYGMPWAFVLAAMEWCARQFNLAGAMPYHMLVASIIILGNLVLACLLARNFTITGAIIYLLAPMTLVLTGYHSQFNNFPIVLGIAGMAMLDPQLFRSYSGNTRRVISSMLFGVSMWIKHIFLFYPALWLSWDRLGSWPHRVGAACIAYAVLAIGFCLFILDDASLEGFNAHVVHYNSTFGSALFPNMLARIANRAMDVQLYQQAWFLSLCKAIWLVAVLVCTRAAFRLGAGQYSMFVYLIAFAAFAPSFAAQYTWLALPALVLYPRSISLWAFVVISTFCQSQSLLGIALGLNLDAAAHAIEWLNNAMIRPLELAQGCLGFALLEWVWIFKRQPGFSVVTA
ncbi:hypothetical protein HED60_22510 [Planctomycetales bacterium ZRK34]|nr:hypothetical protein HED60_22510 [Planctomycetales bacterium ZRK34]